MKKIILSLMLLILISSVSAQEVCEYNGIKTKLDYHYQEPGKKTEYAKSLSICSQIYMRDLQEIVPWIACHTEVFT